jgi:hypothetical protein
MFALAVVGLGLALCWSIAWRQRARLLKSEPWPADDDGVSADQLTSGRRHAREEPLTCHDSAEPGSRSP